MLSANIYPGCSLVGLLHLIKLVCRMCVACICVYCTAVQCKWLVLCRLPLSFCLHEFSSTSLHSLTLTSQLTSISIKIFSCVCEWVDPTSESGTTHSHALCYLLGGQVRRTLHAVVAIGYRVQFPVPGRWWGESFQSKNYIPACLANQPRGCYEYTELDRVCVPVLWLRYLFASPVYISYLIISLIVQPNLQSMFVMC